MPRLPSSSGSIWPKASPATGGQLLDGADSASHGTSSPINETSHASALASLLTEVHEIPPCQTVEEWCDLAARLPARLFAPVRVRIVLFPQDPRASESDAAPGLIEDDWREAAHHLFPDLRRAVLFPLRFRRAAAGVLALWPSGDLHFSTRQTEMLSAFGALIGPMVVQMRGELAARASEEKYCVLFENNPQPMYVYDLITLRILAANRAALAHYEYPREEFMGMTIKDLRPVIQSPSPLDDAQRSMEGLHVSGEWRHRKRGGAVIDVQIVTYAVPFEGRPAKLVVATDVTERNASHARMEKLAAFPRYNPNPIVEFTNRGQITYTNEAAEDMLATFKVGGMTDLLPLNTRDLVRACMTSGAATLRQEVIVQGRTLSWSFFPLPGLATVHCYGGDITERVALEGQLRQAQKMESIGKLAGGIAHDFNNILTAILGYSTMLGERRDLPPDVVNACGEIRAASHRAANLTRQLLLFGRKQAFSPHPVDLNKAVEEIQAMLRRLLGETIDIECGLSDEPSLVFGDFGMLEQVIVNLAVNARDAMPAEDGVLSISTTRRVVTEASGDRLAGEYVCLTMRDNGCGIPKEIQGKMFEPFFTTKEAGKGTGLGLSTVYGIVKQHQGWVEVESTTGKGTAFHVLLPRLPARRVKGSETVEAEGRERPAGYATAKLRRLPPRNGSGATRAQEDEVRGQVEARPGANGAAKAEGNGAHRPARAPNSVSRSHDLFKQLTDAVASGPVPVPRPPRAEVRGNGIPSPFGPARILEGRVQDAAAPQALSPADTAPEPTPFHGTSGPRPLAAQSAPGRQRIHTAPRVATILLVEDEAAVRHLTEDLLTSTGHRILAAGDGVEALGLWQRERENIDLLLTDVVMPHGFSGPDLARRIWQDAPGLRVIYTSGYTCDLFDNDSIPAHARFLSKPYSVAQMLDLVREMLAMKGE